jgi:hypothetical protein
MNYGTIHARGDESKEDNKNPYRNLHPSLPLPRIGRQLQTKRIYFLLAATQLAFVKVSLSFSALAFDTKVFLRRPELDLKSLDLEIVGVGRGNE